MQSCAKWNRVPTTISGDQTWRKCDVPPERNFGYGKKKAESIITDKTGVGYASTKEASLPQSSTAR